MNLTVNGKDYELADDATVAALVVDMGLAGKPLAVELNKEVIRFRDHPTTTLNDGDTVEVVTLVGGG